jgi:hypothetical protein
VTSAKTLRDKKERFLSNMEANEERKQESLTTKTENGTKTAGVPFRE